MEGVCLLKTVFRIPIMLNYNQESVVAGKFGIRTGDWGLKRVWRWKDDGLVLAALLLFLTHHHCYRSCPSPPTPTPPTPLPHLCFAESQEVYGEVGLNAIDGSGQSDSAEQQHSQDHVGHRGCDPHNLKRSRGVHAVTAELIARAREAANVPAVLKMPHAFECHSYLSRGLDSLPEAEVEENDHHAKTGSQLPAGSSEITNAVAVLNVEDPSPE